MDYTKLNSGNLDWDSLRVFLALVENGSLSAAARRLGLSQPTIGRRIQALERSLDRKLFDRMPNGYAPTAAGAALLPMAQSMAEAAEAIERSRASGDALSGTVRISAGSSLCRFLSRRVSRLLDGLTELDLEFAASFQFTNLSRREADIAIRNQRPEHGDLTTRRMARPAVAIYGSRHYVERHKVALGPGNFADWDWVGYDEARQYLSTARWLKEKLNGARQRIRCTTPVEKLDAVRGGGGLALLACYAADTEASLVRVSDPIPELRANTWMVVHQDLRHVPRIRAIIDRLDAMYRDYAPLFDGERPMV